MTGADEAERTQAELTEADARIDRLCGPVAEEHLGSRIEDPTDGRDE